VQERLRGIEITIDALLDNDGEPLHYVPRQRIKTVAGESVQGVTIDDSKERSWIIAMLSVAGHLGATGPITAQAFLCPRGPVLIEINPRFGGGFPLGYAAGARYPEWLVDACHGEVIPLTLGEYTRGLFMTRSHAEQFAMTPAW
jgi:carbamoyl-phosphate synthase large subunit